MTHAEVLSHSHPVVWRQLLHEVRTGQYERSQVWDLLDALCMGTLLLMLAGSVLSVIAILLVQIF